MPSWKTSSELSLFQYWVQDYMHYQKLCISCGGLGMAKSCISGAKIEFDMICDFTSLLPYLGHAVVVNKVGIIHNHW